MSYLVGFRAIREFEDVIRIDDAKNAVEAADRARAIGQALPIDWYGGPHVDIITLEEFDDE